VRHLDPSNPAEQNAHELGLGSLSAQFPMFAIHTPLFRVLFAGGPLLVDGVMELVGVLG
jgi:hypothetical protein